MSNIKTKQESVIQEFSQLDNWDDKYIKIIARGKALADMPEQLKTDDNIVKGCQSIVWLSASIDEGKVKYQADSDALIVRGLIALLLEVYSDQHPEDILHSPPEFIAKIGMQDHLSLTRKNGLDKIIKQIQFYAMAFQTLLSQQK